MIYFRFVNIEQRMEIWSKRPLAKKNNLYMEEWLTGMKKLMGRYFSKNYIKDTEKNCLQSANF